MRAARWPLFGSVDRLSGPVCAATGKAVPLLGSLCLYPYPGMWSMETPSSLKLNACRRRPWRGGVEVRRNRILDEREGELHIRVGFDPDFEPI